MIVRSSLRRWILFWGCFVLLPIVFVVVVNAQKSVSDVTWQSSESVSVKLGVRDKYGELESYEALFVVTGPDGKQYKAEKHVSGDEWGFCYFPDDFDTYAKPGKYSWECIVGGEVVLNGDFEYMTVDSYSDQARVMR